MLLISCCRNWVRQRTFPERLSEHSSVMASPSASFSSPLTTPTWNRSWFGQGHWWWERCASMHFSRAYVKCAVSGGCIYVVGGTCPAEVYDVGENRWQRLPEMVDVQFFCNGIIALENQIFAYGYDILDPEIVIEPDVNSARVYDVLSRSWSSVGFDFSKCCTALGGRLLFDIIDGTLITYDMTSHVSTVFDGRLQVRPQHLLREDLLNLIQTLDFPLRKACTDWIGDQYMRGRMA